MLGWEIIRQVQSLGASFKLTRTTDGWSAALVNGKLLPPALIETIKKHRDDVIWSLTTPFRIVNPQTGEELWEGKEWEWDLNWPLCCEKSGATELTLEYYGFKGWVRCLWVNDPRRAEPIPTFS